MRKKYFGPQQGGKESNDILIGEGPPKTPGGKPFDEGEPKLNPTKMAPTVGGGCTSGTAKGGGAASRGLKYRSC